MIARKLTRIITFLSVGVITGTLGGLVSAISLTLANRYLHYMMIRLLAFTFQRYLNKWILLSTLFFFLLYLINLLLAFLARRLRRKNERRFIKLAWVHLVCAAFLLYGGWAINHYWLPYRFHFLSLLADAGILVLTLFLRWLLIKVKWENLSKPKTTKSVRRIAVVSIVFLLILNSGVAIESCTNAPEGPNIILISIDTLRHDALGVNDCEIEDITPNIDRFSQRAVNFKTCIAPSPWTLPSHMSMLTSLYPETHKMDAPNAKFMQLSVDPSIITLAETLRNQNYFTAAITEGSYVDSKYGFSQGFVVYDNDSDNMKAGLMKLKKILARCRQKKFFIFFHTYDVHAPYNHTQYLDRLVDKKVISAKQKAELEEYISNNNPSIKMLKNTLKDLNMFNKAVSKNLYLGGVNRMDFYFGLLIDYLKESNLLENTMIIFTSDHGEEFAEHNESSFYDHHYQGLFEEHIRVPLIIYIPGDSKYKGETVDIQVGLIDIMPTILGYLQITPLEKTAGTNVLGYAEIDTGGEARRPLFAGTHYDQFTYMKAVRLSDAKYIKNYLYTFEPENEALFDLRKDPSELDDISQRRLEELKELRHTLDEFVEEANEFLILKTSETELDEEQKSRLKSLGYLH